MSKSCPSHVILTFSGGISATEMQEQWLDRVHAGMIHSNLKSKAEEQIQ